jgi:two-component system cell cycle response regulator CpdR
MAHTVLVVDDEPMVLEVTALMLEDLGCVVFTAKCGTEALSTLADEPTVTVLITDVNMPGISGYELAEHARKERPNLSVLLLSGRETADHGFPLIRKPFLREDLQRSMEQFVEGPDKPCLLT